jgi:FkbM family methyltransferase
MKKGIRRIAEGMGYRIFKNEFLPPGIDPWLDVRRVLTPDRIDLILDVGANIGQTTIRLAREFPSAKCISVEPASATFRLLNRAVARLPNVETVNAAAGSRKGVATLFVRENSELNSLNTPVNVPEGSGVAEKVRVTSVDDLINNHGDLRSVLLKTDTEGYDLEVLKGAHHSLQSGRVRAVFAEVTFLPNDVRHTQFAPLQEFLQTWGYHFYALYDLVHHNNPRTLESCNALFFRGGDPLFPSDA